MFASESFFTGVKSLRAMVRHCSRDAGMGGGLAAADFFSRHGKRRGYLVVLRFVYPNQAKDRDEARTG